MCDISVIIPSFNTKKITERCLRLLKENINKSSLTHQIIVVDNGSSDGSRKMLTELEKKLDLTIIFNKKNVGYAKANNIGLTHASGKYILFLNSDVYVSRELNFSELVSYLDVNQHVGGLTVKVIRLDKSLDKACHRGFPTLWRSFCYFMKLEHIFAKIPIVNRVFCGYHLLYKDFSRIHEIDSASGAFFLIQKRALDKIEGFDESFFMYGEDLDLSFRIKNQGLSILFYPNFEVTHLKYQSGLAKSKESDIQHQVRTAFFNAMEIFYTKHYSNSYPRIITRMVLTAITFLKWKNEKNRD